MIIRLPGLAVLVAVCTALALAQTPATITVKGDVVSPLTVKAEDLAAMPREKVVIPDPNGAKVEYEGVSLREILTKAGASPVGQLRGNALTTYVLATAHDGYQVVFTLAEIDPSFGNAKIVIVDKRDGKPLAENQGPFRLLCPDDKVGSRSVRMLETLEIVRLKK